MLRSFASLVFCLVLCSSFARAEVPEKLLQLRQEIVDVLQDTTLLSEDESELPMFERTRRLADATAILATAIPAYLKASNTRFHLMADEKGILSSFEIEPDWSGSWLNKVAAILDQEHLKFQIHPSFFLNQQLGYFKPDERVVALVAPPFAGSMSSTMAHEMLHYLIVQNLFERSIPHLEQVQWAYPKTEGKELKMIHLSELSAIAAALLDLSAHFSGGELNSYQKQKLDILGTRLLFYSRAFRVELLDFIESQQAKLERGSLRLLSITPERAAGVHTENSFGTQMHFDNLKAQNEKDGFLKRGLKFLTPGWKSNFGTHYLDKAQIMSRLRAFHDIILALEIEMERFSAMSPEEKMRNAHKPWQWLVEANSKWLERLGYTKTHPVHQLLSRQGDLIYCGGNLDPSCSARASCENLLR